MNANKKMLPDGLLSYFLRYSIEEIIEEEVAIGKISALDIMSMQEHIEKHIDNSEYRQKFFKKLNIPTQAQKFLEKIKINSFAETNKKVYFEKICLLFSIRYFEDMIDICDYDINGVPSVFPDKLKDFIYAAYDCFVKITQTKLVSLYLLPPKREFGSVGFNLVQILQGVITGEIDNGADITELIFKNVEKNQKPNELFLKLCTVSNSRYILKNNRCDSLDFQIAVLDLLNFADSDNKRFFDLKVSEYLSG